MLTQIQFSNYRAFKRGQFQLKPITIFVGANSVGKTSLLQLPLILKQTASVTDRNYKAALRLHGREVSIGNPKNFFFNQNTSENFEISLTFASHSFLRRIKDLYYRDFLGFLFSIIQYYEYSLRKISSTNKFVEKFAANAKRLESQKPLTDEELQDFLEFLDIASKEVSKIPNDKRTSFGFRHIAVRGRVMRFDEPPTVSALDLERTHRLLSALQKAVSDTEFTYTAKIFLTGSEEAKYLRINELALSQKNQDILKVVLQDGSVSKISSAFCEDKYVDNYQKSLDKFVNPTSTIFSFFKNQKGEVDRYQYPELVRSIFFAAQNELSEYFEDENISHIGPLRAYPKRFYFLDIAQTGATEGDLLVETLRENDELRGKVNKWLERFGIDINVKQLEEIIYRLSVRSKGNAFDLDITDVGFGISQILPILVETFLSSPGKTIMIEQPEIHLHPKMQGELADLFIDILNMSKDDEDRRCLLIETHSEYLLSRLRRRIAEGKLSHSDVALYFIEKASHDGGSTIRGSYMPADGSFEWPAEFFESDLDDTLAYLNSAMKKKSERQSNTE